MGGRSRSLTRRTSFRLSAAALASLLAWTCLPPTPSALSAARKSPRVTAANVGKFAPRFNDLMAQIQKPLIKRLREMTSNSDRQRTVSFTLRTAGGKVTAEGFGLILPKPAKFELTLDLDGVHDDPKTGKPLSLDGLLQFDLVPYRTGKAIGLFAGRLKLSGAFGGGVDLTGEVDGAKVVALDVESGGKKLRGTRRRPQTLVSYVSTIAGNGESGLVDGKGATARFAQPDGVAVNDDGTLFVADSGNDAVRKIALNGAVTTLAENIQEPGDIGVDGQGRVVVSEGTYPDDPLVAIDADSGAVERIVYHEPDHINTLCSGCDGRSPIGTMTWPAGIDVQGGVYYVAEYTPPHIRLVLPDGFVTTIRKDSTTGCNSMSDVAAGNDGEIYWVAHWANCDAVFVLRPDGTEEVVAGNDTGDFGTDDGVGANATLFHPGGIVFDGSRFLYVADSGNNLIRRVDIFSRRVQRVAGCLAHQPGFDCTSQIGFREGDGDVAQFHWPLGISLDRWGDLFVADELNNAIRMVRIVNAPERDPVITSFAPWAVAQGQRTTIEVRGLNLALAESADLGSGVSTTLQHAGSRRLFVEAIVSPDAAPGPRTLRISTPYGSATTPPDLSFEILEDEYAGATVSSIVGTGTWTPGAHDGPGEESEIAFPGGMTIVDDDSFLVADPVEQRIRMITCHRDNNLACTPKWDSLPWAGQAFSPGDSTGKPQQSQMLFPSDVVKAAQGVYFIADTGNERVKVVGIDPSGDTPVDMPDELFNTRRLGEHPGGIGAESREEAVVSLLSSSNLKRLRMRNDGQVQDFAGINNALRCTRNPNDATQPMGIPVGVAVTEDLTYVTDVLCQTIWTVDSASGEVKDIRGDTSTPGSDIGPCSDGPVSMATFGVPMDVAVDGNGNVWFADTYCNSIRIIKHIGSDDSTLAGQLTGFLSGIAGHLPKAVADKARNKIESLDQEYLETNRWWVITVTGSHFGEGGFADGPVEDALFFAPVGLAISGKRVFVSDAGNHRIRMITLP